MVGASLGVSCSLSTCLPSPRQCPLELEFLLRYTLNREGIHILLAAVFLLFTAAGVLPLPVRSQLRALFLPLAGASVKVFLLLASHAWENQLREALCATPYCGCCTPPEEGEEEEEEGREVALPPEDHLYKEAARDFRSSFWLGVNLHTKIV